MDNLLQEKKLRLVCRPDFQGVILIYGKQFLYSYVFCVKITLGFSDVVWLRGKAQDSGPGCPRFKSHWIYWIFHGSVPGQDLNPFSNKPWFLRVCSSSLLKTQWEKEELLVMSNFSFSHTVFYLFGEHSPIFIEFEIVVCKLFQFGTV